MNKNRRSSMKSNAKQENNKVDNVEEAFLRKNPKVDVGNESPQCSYGSRVSGHSTPIRKQEYIDKEDSPELDYGCSPISLPCTQDGGNEIAWDWQTPVHKGLNDKSKPLNNLIETPKRTRQLQKKRNSNSPLLQKPLKRKQVKMENIENIGKLTAELKALSEKMKDIQRNFNDRVTEDEEDMKEESKEDSKLIVELENDSDDDVVIEAVVIDGKPKESFISVPNNNKKDYEDLFDDSIDDSMVKCSQEIEEKLKLCKYDRTDIMELSAISEKKESSVSERESYNFTRSNNSTTCSRGSNSSRVSLTNTSNLKTYSNNTTKTNSFSNVSASNAKPSNSNVINVSNGKQALKNLSDFPDDSFDDCLATCVEDDKLLPKLSEYDFSPKSSKKTARQTSSVSVNYNKKTVSNISKPSNCKNPKLIVDDLVEEVETLSDIEAIRKSLPGKDAFENRKFFKSRSLSDQNFPAKAALLERRLLSSSYSLVSKTFPIRGPKMDTNIFPTINDMETTHALNRLEESEDDNCIVKYKSTSNLSSIKETDGSQPVHCTPEEIERKRLEAKMRLEAKKKLQQANNARVANAPSEVPVKKSVKR